MTVKADAVIVAVGQLPDPSFLRDGPIEVDHGGRIVVDPETLMTGWEGVFAGGDAVSGPATVVEAIAAGQRAAVSIDRFLGGPGIIWPQGREVVRTSYDEEMYAGERARQVPPQLAPEERSGNFNEVEGCFLKEQAIEEAKRCLHCDRRD